jgi:uncharacterized protein YndB with AHSA1/START domain
MKWLDSDEWEMRVIHQEKNSVIQEPTGQLDCSSAIPELVYERLLTCSRADAWAALTEPDRTARWIGSWTGEAGPGKSVEVTWLAEEGTPKEHVRILKCEPPHRLALATGPDKDAPWLVTIELIESDEGVRLEFRQQMSNGLSPALVGTGWEFYLDRYVASLEDGVAEPFEAYHVLQPHYEELQAAMALCDG